MKKYFIYGFLLFVSSSYRPLYSKKEISNDYTPLFNEGLGKMGMLEKIDSYLSKSLKSN